AVRRQLQHALVGELEAHLAFGLRPGAARGGLVVLLVVGRRRRRGQGGARQRGAAQEKSPSRHVRHSFRGVGVGRRGDILAVGEKQRSSGSEVLAAVIAGYELYCRIQDIIVGRGPWDHVTASALAAPAIAGWLMKLDAGPLANAL